MHGQQRVIIENVKPVVQCGQFPVKRVVHEKVRVEADIYCDSHDILSAELLYKYGKDSKWQKKELEYDINDSWVAEFNLTKIGIWSFGIQAWVDHFKTWHRDILTKIEASVEFDIDLLIGGEIIKSTLEEYNKIPPEDKAFLNEMKDLFTAPNTPRGDKIRVILEGTLYDIMVKYPVKKHITKYEKELLIEVDRTKANFSSWYEVFPRSLGSDKKHHGTFKDCINFLPYVSEMGFDVLYLPPYILLERPGAREKTTAQHLSPESRDRHGPLAVNKGVINPYIRSWVVWEDFRGLVKKASEYGIDIALDVAFQCSPDHPWVKEQPQWFRERPDGSLQYAENPPKKYEDIYPLNFETEDWKNLWEELKSVFLYWIEQGVKIFRVDNPHTKSLRFWGWTIGEIKKDHPDVIFLAEAFTRPKVMNQLAKSGFTQSYTYFTWRNTKYEITTYCQELVNTEARDFFRPNFWPNTPDILPEYLQVAPKSGFIQRIALAATLSSNYGMYGPAYELMENRPVQAGKEEYLNSEKYEIKNWDLNSPQSLKSIITRINKIRKENKALQNTHSLQFHEINNEALLCYSKTSDELDNIILVVVNLDPHHTQSGWLNLPLEEFKMDHHEPFQVHDLLSGSFYLWNGAHNYVEIDPGIMPLHIFKIRRKVRSERDFDYFM